MKNYEKLEIRLELLSDSDIISTSWEVTTEEIKLPWQGASESSYDI